MARCRLFLVLSLLAVIAATVVAVGFASRSAGVSRLNQLRIGAGMRLEQVEAILGGPPGNYRADGIHVIMEWGLHRIGYRREVWYGDEGDVLIEFDQDRRVATCEWRPRHATTMDKMLRWLGR